MNDKAWLAILAKYGPITVVAIGLVWFLAMHVDGQLHMLSEALYAHTSQAGSDQRELRWFMRAICINTARTESERAACVPPPGNEK